MHENMVREAFVCLFIYFFTVDMFLFPEVIMFSVSVRVLGAESAVAWMCGPALTL